MNTPSMSFSERPGTLMFLSFGALVAIGLTLSLDSKPHKNPPFTPGPLKFAGTVGAQFHLVSGTNSYMSSASPADGYSVLFVDDGKSGMFYAVDPRGGDTEFDCVTVYSANQSSKKDKAATISIIWSHDNKKALLAIDDEARAVFDFGTHRAFCHSDIPAQGTSWIHYLAALPESVLADFKLKD